MYRLLYTFFPANRPGLTFQTRKPIWTFYLRDAFTNKPLDSWNCNLIINLILDRTSDVKDDETDKDVQVLNNHADILAQLYCATTKYEKKKVFQEQPTKSWMLFARPCVLISLGEIPLRKELSSKVLTKSGNIRKLAKTFNDRRDLIMLKNESKSEKLKFLNSLTHYYHLFYNLFNYKN
jgi:hypothetical protein